MDDENTTQTPAELPTDLSGLSAEELDDALGNARSEGEELGARDDADLTDADVERLEALAAFVEAVGVERDARAQAAAERTARAQAAADRLAAGDAAEGEGEGEPAEGEPAEGDEGEGEGEGESLAAGATRRTAARIQPRRNRTPREQSAPTQPLMSLVAAADVGAGIQAGQTLSDMQAVAQAFSSRSRSFPQGVARVKNERHQFGVATIERHFDRTADGLYVGNRDFSSGQALFEAASRESRLTDGSLVAAGGWCAPSQTMYGIPSGETLDGILDLPTVGVDRGGISYTPGPDFADIYSSAGFAQTEAQAIAGTTKPCIEVDCPDFSEVRLDAVGICVKAPLLTRAAYPEAIQRWIEGTVIANAHKVNARMIAGMRTALGTALAPTLTGTPITWSLLTILELVCEGQRQAYRLGDNESLEVVAPRWLRIAVRADLANRMGIGADSVSNTLIAQHFADRGVMVQWVLGYLELASPTTNVAFPTTVEVMVYPAGAFVKGVADVISLDTVYDTADLQTNVYTAAFVEDGVLLAKMRNGGKRITLPVNVTGMLGAAQLDDNWGTAQIENVGAAAA